AVSNCGRDELVPVAEVITAILSLVTVVELIREIRGHKGVQDRGGGVFGRPHNRVGVAIGRNAGSRTRVAEAAWSLRRTAGQARTLEWERLQPVVHRAIIQRTVEVGRHRPDATGERTAEFLVDGIIVGWIEFTHVGSVNQINVLVFAGTDSEV